MRRITFLQHRMIDRIFSCRKEESMKTDWEGIDFLKQGKGTNLETQGLRATGLIPSWPHTSLVLRSERDKKASSEKIITFSINELKDRIRRNSFLIFLGGIRSKVMRIRLSFIGRWKGSCIIENPKRRERWRMKVS